MQNPQASSVSWPAPPWLTSGRGLLCPYLVPERHLGGLPAGLRPLCVGGYSFGILGYIEYLPPSPLIYRELFWMPAVVHGFGKAGRRWKGYYVSRMYVDSEASMRGGRELWALPKQLARFEPLADGVRVHTDDGASLTLHAPAFGFAEYERLREISEPLRGGGLPLRQRVATLQVRGAQLVRFQSTLQMRVGVARYQVSGFHYGREEWLGFLSARRVAPLGTHLTRFDATMHPPTLLDRPN